MNVVDSSGWLEYFAGDSNAEHFAPVLCATAELIVPTLSVYEVFKRARQQRGEEAALQAIALMQQGQIVELTTQITLAAVHLSLELKLPMVDSMILATARIHEAILWTQDSDFKDVPGVRYFAKKSTA